MLVVLCAERDCDFSFGFIMAAHKVVLFFLLLCYLFPLYSLRSLSSVKQIKKLNGFYLLLQALKAESTLPIIQQVFDIESYDSHFR